jgi:hypothetical protein
MYVLYPTQTTPILLFIDNMRMGLLSHILDGNSSFIGLDFGGVLITRERLNRDNKTLLSMVLWHKNIFIRIIINVSTGSGAAREVNIITDN